MGSGEDAGSTGDLDLTDVVRIEGAGELLTIIEGGGIGGLGIGSSISAALKPRSRA